MNIALVVLSLMMTVCNAETARKTPRITLELRHVVDCMKGSIPVRTRKPTETPICVAGAPLVVGRDVDAAGSYVDDLGQLVMTLKVSAEGAERLRNSTSKLLESDEVRQIAVMIDGAMVARAVVVEVLSSDVEVSLGGIAKDELQQWIDSLNADARERKRVKSAYHKNRHQISV